MRNIPFVERAGRPSFLGLGLVAIGLLAAVALSGQAVAQSEQRPNVLFLLADDLGYGDLGCFGQQLIQTPNLDRLASQGMRFTQAYAGATVCAPSRCSLMTGLHNGHAPIRGNYEIQPEGQAPMPADTYTVAHLMREAGYATGLIGKWGLGYPGSDSTPNKMGFDYFFGYNCQRKAHEYYPEYLWRNGEKVPLGGNHYSHDLMADEILQFIRQHRDEPFFLYAAFTIPHSKLQVPDLGPYADRPWPENLKKLAAMITRMDRDIGRILDLLDELQLSEKTLVFFASDNGAAYRDQLFDHSGPLRGRKRDMYEGGIRSPSIVRWTGRIPAGAVSDQVWTFYDVLPTLADLVGQPIPREVDGISVLPALVEGASIDHPPLYFEFHERGFQQAARIGGWKGVKLGPDRPLELFDLARDLGETRNVAKEHPEVVAQIEAFLKSARTESELWPVGAQAGREGKASGQRGQEQENG